jgi:hypothetical protein
MEELYVIATRGRNNKEIYLKCGKNLMEWTEDIEESYADFNYSDIEKFAKEYFKNFKKWYIKEWKVNI